MPSSGETNIVTHLEMRSPEALRGKQPPAGFTVTEVDPPEPELNRRWYCAVGAAWRWTDRLPWPGEQWRRHVEREELETWLGRLEGRECGYFELERQDGGDVEIAYFGLLPEFLGRGLGGPLLTAAAARAWAVPGTRRVWLHTCTHDHPRALANYLARGFTPFKRETL